MTENVTIGANVLTAPFRLPAILAKEVATLDAITGGRAILGLGVGANQKGIANWGGPSFEGRREMYRSYRDAMHIIRGLWESGGERSATRAMYNRLWASSSAPCRPPYPDHDWRDGSAA